MPKPILAIISDDIRRDLQDPLKYFSKVKIAHFYGQARYQDMKEEEFIGTVNYQNPADLYKKLEEIKPDIIQGPEPYASRTALKNCWAVLKYHKKYRTPFIFPVLENRPPLIKFGSVIGLIMQIFLGYYSKNAVKIISLNEGATTNLLAAGIKKDKIAEMIWGTWGINSNEFNLKSQNSNLKTNDKKIILFVGKVEEQKGILDLLEAFKSVKKEIPTLQLNVIGAGSLVDKIKNEEGVNYLGVIKNQDLPKYFQQATLTCVPSKTTKIWAEQVGMVNIQSLACGTPIVSTISGAIPEYTPDGLAGILVQESSPDQLAKAIYKILSDQKLWQKFSDSGLKLVREKYLARDNILKAEKFISEILDD